MHYIRLYVYTILNMRAIVRQSSLDGLDSGKIRFICPLHKEKAAFTVGLFDTILIHSYFKDSYKPTDQLSEEFNLPLLAWYGLLTVFKLESIDNPYPASYQLVVNIFSRYS